MIKDNQKTVIMITHDIAESIYWINKPFKNP
jgi:ABC-type nitrate/sulfonate/bicarbonate transport system ATPase subunit